MVSITVNRNYQRATGGNYLKQNTLGGGLKEIIFDVQFDDDETYPDINGTETGTNRGIDLDFSRWFVKLITVQDAGARELITSGVLRIPVFSVSDRNPAGTTDDLALDDGHALFEVFNAAGGSELAEDAAETSIDGASIKVKVIGY